MPLLAECCITVGARGSSLSLAQCCEVLNELRHDHPEVEFHIDAISTTGDQDLNTSLRMLDKSDFFTKEIDALLLNNGCRVAIHSAKDLPEPIPAGLKIIALTRGQDSADSLVMRDGVIFETLPAGSLIATSSIRREENIKSLRSDLTFCDIRGTVQQRLDKLESGDVDAVVIAEAALIRLELNHLNRLKLPGPTAPLQGKLAILAREDDDEMEALFSCIDTRTRCLFVGIDLPTSPHDTKYIHYPLIRPLPRDPHTPEIDEAIGELDSFTHIIFTSKSSVRIFFAYLQDESIEAHQFICVGASTAQEVLKHGGKHILTAKTETAEGVIELLKSLKLTHANILWPHSSLSRPVITCYLAKHGIKHRTVIIYDTVHVRPSETIETTGYDAIYFTSPSTVNAYTQFFGSLPQDKELRSIGPITREAIELFRTIRQTN